MAIRKEIKEMEFLDIQHPLEIPNFILENKELTPTEKIVISKILQDHFLNEDDIPEIDEYEKVEFIHELGLSLKEVNEVIKLLIQKQVLVNVEETRSSISFNIGYTSYTVEDYYEDDTEEEEE